MWAVVLMVLLLSPPCSASGFKLVDAYWAAPLTLGAYNVLVVKVEYCGEGIASSLNASLTIENVAGTDLTAEDSYSGQLEPGVVLELRFNVSVPEDAKASYYWATLVLEYLEDGTLRFDTLRFQVGFVGEPKFSVSASPSTLVKGGSNEVTLRISLSEAPARRIEVRLSPASPYITVLGESTASKELMEAGEVLTLTPTVVVDSLAGDSVALTVTISFEDYNGAPSTTTLTVGFSVATYSRPHISVSVSPSKVTSGEPTTVLLTLTNVGGSTAKDVRVTVSPASPGVALLSGTSRALGDLPPGSRASFTLTLRVDRQVSGTTSLNVVVSYRDVGGDPHSSTVTIGLEVARSPVPIISVTTPNLTVTPGKEGNIIVNISNIGRAAANDLVVDVVSGQGLMVLSESRFKIDRLNPGENVSIRVRAFAAAPLEESAAVLNVKFRYVDPSGYEHQDAVNLALKVEEVGKPLVEVRALNETLTPNKVNKVMLVLENLGTGAAVNVSLNLASQTMEVASVLGVSERHVRRLEVNDSVAMEFSIFVQPKVYGAIQLVASLSYEDEWGNVYHKLLAVGFNVEGTWQLSIAKVSTMPPAIFPGDKMVRLIVTVTNTGDYLARNVDLKLVGTKWIKPSTLTAAKALIPYLPVGQVATVMFLVDVDEDAPPGNHELLIISGNQEAKLQLTVLEKAKFRVWNITRLSVYPGERGYRLVLAIENISNATAEDVRVDIYSPFITGTTSTQIGTMQPGEKRLLLFEVDVEEEAPLGPLTLEAQVSWVQENRHLSQTSRVLVYVVKKEIPWALYATVLGLALAAFCIALYKLRPELLSGFLSRVRSIASG